MNLKEFNEKLEERQLDESIQLVTLGNAIKNLAETGIIPKWAVIPIYVGVVLAGGGLVAGAMAVLGGGLDEIGPNLKKFIRKIKDRAKYTFKKEEIDKVVDDAEKAIKKLPKGKRNYIKSLINKYKKKELTSSNLLDLKREIEDYLKDNKEE